MAPAPADAPFQRYSWALAALGSYEAAASLAERAGRRAPDEPFVVVPIETNGRILYRVLGGAREDRQALQDTRGAIAQAAGIGAEAPFARQAGLAFALGDFPRRQDAVDRAGALRGQGVWGYVLQLGAEGSSGAFRVYAGAYESETEARPLLARLRQAGIPDPALMERRGRVVR